MLPNSPLGEKGVHPRIQGVLTLTDTFKNDLAGFSSERMEKKKAHCLIFLYPLERPFFSVYGNMSLSYKQTLICISQQVPILPSSFPSSLFSEILKVHVKSL